MEQIVSRENMISAYKQVKRNNGAPGVDGLTVTELQSYLKSHWSPIKTSLLRGEYQPSPVRRMSIPKQGGGERILVIPTV